MLLHLEVHTVQVEMTAEGTNKHTCLCIRLIRHKALLKPHFWGEKHRLNAVCYSMLLIKRLLFFCPHDYK